MDEINKEMFTLDFEDRRRLAVAQLVLLGERADGYVTRDDFATVVLDNSIDGSDEHETMGKLVLRSIQRMLG